LGLAAETDTIDADASVGPNGQRFLGLAAELNTVNCYAARSKIGGNFYDNIETKLSEK